MAAAEGSLYRSSTTAPVNIAVVKYWGKRDAVLNLPTNSSLSVTLSQRSLRAHTTASCSASYSASEGDTLLLNNKPEPIQSSQRTQGCLSQLRRLRADLESSDPSLPKLSSHPLHIVSANNFPTAAGLASSAAGFAALIRAIADLYALPQSPEQLSLISRQGSGSACRSMLGGYVAWRKGGDRPNSDGSDSYAQQVAPTSHWPSMRALILVVNAAKKDVASTAGMQVTVKTSGLHATRAQEVVPRQMEAMEQAIQNRDFASFATVTMQESNSFHAVCLDSWPPIHYLNDVSRAAMRIVEDINAAAAAAAAAASTGTDAAKPGSVGGGANGAPIAAYTFDAGPNPVIFYLSDHNHQVAGTFRAILGEGVEGWEGEYAEQITVGELGEILDQRAVEKLRQGVSRVICTGVGDGPEEVDDHLVTEDGQPVTV